MTLRRTCDRLISTRSAVPLSLWTAFILAVLAADGASGQLPTNDDPSNQIRFHSPAEANARRAALIDFIWDGDLPDATPSVIQGAAFPSQAVGIDPLNVARVDRLNANVSGWGYNSISYLMHPVNTANANRLVVVSQGHAHDLEAGVGTTANHMLQNGFTVLVVKMPLLGWNSDRTANIPGEGVQSYNSHDQIIQNAGPDNGGHGYRLFLEPIVQGINHFVSTTPNYVDVNMIGLSGGGWATNMMAALDERIRISVPVAGSAPFYIRNVGGSVGDLEQYYSPLYDEDIQPDGTGGGVATWLEIYALGGYGEGRRQLKVTNRFDTCCFAGTHADSYAPIVTQKVADLGAGDWSYTRDSTHHAHQISAHVLSTVINPAFGISEPKPSPRRLPVADHFNDASSGVPKGWSIDPSSGGGVTAVESNDRVAIRGPGLASIVFNAPIHVQSDNPITITIGIHSMSPDNFMGVFLTDNIGSRAFHVGPLFNASNKQLGLNADNGNGFNTSSDRAMFGAVPNYDGGAAVMKMTFDEEGFTVDFDAGEAGSISSGRQTWSRIPGGFDPVKLGDYSQLYIQSFDINNGAPASLEIDYIAVSGPELAGDYNRDGTIDAADYTLWRDNRGLSGNPGIPGDGDDGSGIGIPDGVVNEADREFWKSRFGDSLPEGGESAVVPEPSAILLQTLALPLVGLLTKNVKNP